MNENIIKTICSEIKIVDTNKKYNMQEQIPKEFEKQIEIEEKKDEGKKSLIPKVENVLDIYSNLQIILYNRKKFFSNYIK